MFHKSEVSVSMKMTTLKKRLYIIIVHAFPELQPLRCMNAPRLGFPHLPC